MLKNSLSNSFILSMRKLKTNRFHDFLKATEQIKGRPLTENLLIPSKLSSILMALSLEVMWSTFSPNVGIPIVSLTDGQQMQSREQELIIFGSSLFHFMLFIF